MRNSLLTRMNEYTANLTQLFRIHRNLEWKLTWMEEQKKSSSERRMSMMSEDATANSLDM